jgi:hypothetical protein
VKEKRNTNGILGLKSQHERPVRRVFLRLSGTGRDIACRRSWEDIKIGLRKIGLDSVGSEYDLSVGFSRNSNEISGSIKRGYFFTS